MAVSKELLVKLAGKKQMHREWNHEQASWEEYMDSVWLCQDGIRKAKANLELKLARDPKDNKKDFYRYVSQKKVKKS